jgi:hypothetical protein
MTAYADRLKRLTDSESSVRVRPRSRFEPVLASSEPPWERTAGLGTAPPFELASETEHAPTARRGARVPGGRPQAAEQAPRPGQTTGPPATNPHPAAGDFAASVGRAAASVQAAHTACLTGAQQDSRRIPPAQTGHSETRQTGGPRPEGRRHPATADLPTDRATPRQPGHNAATSTPAGPAWRRQSTGSAPQSSTTRYPAPESSFPSNTVYASRPAVDVEERVGQEPGGAAFGGSHMPIIDRLGGESVGPTVRYLAAGLGAEELPGGDPARAGPPGLHGAERETAGLGLDAPGDVTVTIGRIDVRVGPPQPESSAAAGEPPSGGDSHARPAPSRLEDYLRARSSGRVG